ncbi:MAG: Abi family protein [Microbacteriaceae bacterium]|nr:MAG: Abi family protein [Microbacteriaceae bacterium]
MAEYTKPWLSLDEQLEKLQSRGVNIGDRNPCLALLQAVGYYRLTGYLYPFRESETYLDASDRQRVRVLNFYREGTSIAEAAALIDFDRQLRLLVLDGMERIEVSLRMQVGYVLGKRSAFAHLDPATFQASFVSIPADTPSANGIAVAAAEPTPPGQAKSKHDLWLQRVLERQDNSNEDFVAHFREKYDNRMPIWALTEIMEMGHLSRLYSGLNRELSTAVAEAYDVPSKRVLASWVSSLNYVRNVSAHHARLFNRKLQVAPARPKIGDIPLLDHLHSAEIPKAFGVYNALAVMAYLLRSIDGGRGWSHKVVELVSGFPESQNMTAAAIGVPPKWIELELWR